jgi:hypothetical protein
MIAKEGSKRPVCGSRSADLTLHLACLLHSGSPQFEPFYLKMVFEGDIGKNRGCWQKAWLLATGFNLDSVFTDPKKPIVNVKSIAYSIQVYRAVPALFQFLTGGTSLAQRDFAQF